MRTTSLAPPASEDQDQAAVLTQCGPRQASMKSLRAIERQIDQRAAVIGAARDALPSYGHSHDFARPHIEVDSAGYHYVVVERGQELSRFTTCDLDELLYQVFEDVTFSMAADYELAHRVELRDCRRLIFAKQVELLSQLCDAWAARAIEYQRVLLQAYPFNDDASATR